MEVSCLGIRTENVVALTSIVLEVLTIGKIRTRDRLSRASSLTLKLLLDRPQVIELLAHEQNYLGHSLNIKKPISTSMKSRFYP